MKIDLSKYYKVHETAMRNWGTPNYTIREETYALLRHCARDKHIFVVYDKSVPASEPTNAIPVAAFTTYDEAVNFATTSGQEKLVQIEIKVSSYSAVIKHVTFDFYGTQERAQQAAMGIAKGIELAVAQSFPKQGRWHTICIDNEIVIDSAF